MSSSLWPRDCSSSDSSIHGILQARILEWVAIPFSRRSSWPRDWTWVSCIPGGFFTIWATSWKPAKPKESPDYKILNLKLVCYNWLKRKTKTHGYCSLEKSTLSWQHPHRNCLKKHGSLIKILLEKLVLWVTAWVVRLMNFSWGPRVC